MNKIFIYCPGNIISGGTNSLHILCKALEKNGFEAGMYYINPVEKIINSDIVRSFQTTSFGPPKDLEQNIIIVPETMVGYLKQFNNAQKIVYWLSSVYFFKNPPFKFPFNIKIFRKPIYLDWYTYQSQSLSSRLRVRLLKWAKKDSQIWQNSYHHITNSFFISDFLSFLGIPQTFVLHNPVRDEFYQPLANTPKQKLILVGPKTPKNILYIIKKRFPGFQVLQAKKIPPEEMFLLYQKSILFIELGHSNRDRCIREAALRGCIILVSNSGGNKNQHDTPIADYYKINTSKKYNNLLLNKIDEIIKNYDKHLANFEHFRTFLLEEKKQFEKRALLIFEQITSKN
ncbi:MAG TPA: hypothetical protein PK252_01055 [Bacteroidales bacterium]|nr:hypothetical protein [Bacteroidales bacterium]